MAEERGFSLLLSFAGAVRECDEVAFTHGVEFGMLYERILAGAVAEIVTVIREENVTLVERACARHGWEFERVPIEEDVAEGWVNVTLRKTATGHDGNTHGLRLVHGS